MEKRTKILLIICAAAIILIIVGLIFYKQLFKSSASTAVKTPVAVPSFLLNIIKSGTGSGTISSTPSGISCGSNCGATFFSGSKIVLTEIPASGSTFAGWGGSCTGLSPTCNLTITQAGNVTATFSSSVVKQQLYYLDITKIGAGTVVSDPKPVSCGNSYNDCYASGTKITLTTSPASGSTFTSWGGVCSKLNSTSSIVSTTSGSIAPAGTTGTITGVTTGSTLSSASIASPTCAITLTGNEKATATFALATLATPAIPATTTGTTVSQTTYNLTVTKTGDGTGMIVSDKGGITCGNNCNANLNGGTDVTLTATPATDYYFSGWSGTCSGMGLTCMVAMTSNESVSASFTTAKPKAVTSYNLNVVTKGALVGDVISTPGGIDCGPTTTLCTASFDSGTKVTLVPTLPDSTTVFSGWSGVCSGTGNCNLTMTGNQSVTATFGSK